jgi:hypothetical protein
VLGTRFEKKVCRTTDQLLQAELQAQEATTKAQRNMAGNPRGGNP